jgi:hypothetical protein
MIAYEFEHQALELRRSQESLFLLVAFGDMLGVPVLPPSYALRLLPFALPRLGPWRRRLLRARELGDDHDHHLHGM